MILGFSSVSEGAKLVTLNNRFPSECVGFGFFETWKQFTDFGHLTVTLELQSQNGK